jgi:hypothetical protein
MHLKNTTNFLIPKTMILSDINNKIGILLVCFSLFFIGKINAQDWALEKDNSGVKVYTRLIKGWDLKQFKGVVNVKTNLKTVEKTLRNDVGRCRWMYNTFDTKDVKKVSDNEIYCYSRVAAPWPVSDRDNVTKYTYKKVSDSEMYVYFTNVSGVIAEKSGIVRIKKMEGYWHFKETSSLNVQVSQVAVAEAGGSIPAWLANSAIIDSPFYTLLNLKKHIEANPSLHVKN